MMNRTKYKILLLKNLQKIKTKSHIIDLNLILKENMLKAILSKKMELKILIGISLKTILISLFKNKEISNF